MTSPKLATILPLLHSDDATLRSEAVITLGQLGDEQAIPTRQLTELTLITRIIA